MPLLLCDKMMRSLLLQYLNMLHEMHLPKLYNHNLPFSNLLSNLSIHLEDHVFLFFSNLHLPTIELL